MRRPAIQALIDAVEARFGPVTPFGTFEQEEEGTGFTLDAIPATFSVMIEDDTCVPAVFDIQIMDEPLDAYLLMRGGVTQDGLIELIAQFKGPVANWPS
jgi:hypothetical protein